MPILPLGIDFDAILFQQDVNQSGIAIGAGGVQGRLAIYILGGQVHRPKLNEGLANSNKSTVAGAVWRESSKKGDEDKKGGRVCEGESNQWSGVSS